jgi:hypothetical protein
MACSHRTRTLRTLARRIDRTFALNESWRRRETALQQLAALRANLLALYLAHADARVAPPPEGHLVMLLSELCVLSRAMEAILVAPTVSHGRHMLTQQGRRRHAAVSRLKRTLHTRIALSMAALSAASAGSGSSDASRLVQLLRDLASAWGQLQYIKAYRTPMTTRAFSHVAVWVCSIMFGPYYAWASEATGLGFTIFLAVAIAVALSALLNARYVLEDVSSRYGYDRGTLALVLTSAISILQSASPSCRAPWTLYALAKSLSSSATTSASWRTLEASSTSVLQRRRSR